MIGNFHTSGYVTESDLKTIVLEHNDKLNHKIKSTLRKIHKLKRENLVLSARRKSILQCKSNFNKAKYHYYCTEDFQILFDISERIGKNGNKIQRLRTKVSQLKKSLIPVVDE